MDRDDLVLYEHITQCVTLKGAAAKNGRQTTEADLGLIEDAALIVNAENVAAIIGSLIGVALVSYGDTIWAKPIY